MNIELLIAISVFLTAVFFFAGYTADALRIYNTGGNYLYIAILYVIGSFFFLLYSVFLLYKAISPHPQSAVLGL